MSTLLTFGKGNAKLPEYIATFSLPSGYSCPGAADCLSRANRETGTITDGPLTKFRCFSASQEAMFPSVRKSRWGNMDKLRGKSREEMVALLRLSLPKEPVIRIHVAGDFFSQPYFDAWVQIARENPNKTFYAYTKSLKFWVTRLGNIPSNFKLNASKGGKDDHLIEQFGLKSAEVVFSEEEAKRKGLVVDHDDSNAYLQDSSFALLLHGAQPTGTPAAKALSALKAQGIMGYSRKT